MRSFGRRSAIARGADDAGAAGGGAEPRRDAPETTPFSEVFAQLAAKLVGVVVNISTTQASAASAPKGGPEAQLPAPGAPLDEFFRDFFGEKGAPGGPNPPGSRVASLGSGFIIDPSGLIVTNNHVIANAEQITVTLSDDTTLQAEVVGRDAVSDLALLKVEPKAPLPAAVWGDSAKAQGRRLGAGDRQPVWSRRHGDLRHHLGHGARHPFRPLRRFSADRRVDQPRQFRWADVQPRRRGDRHQHRDLLAVGRFDRHRLCDPVGFARPIIDQLKATGKVERGWIGARIQPVTDDIAEAIGLDKSRGAMIAAVDPASPAAQAKLQPGDVILAFDGKPIDRSRQLPRLVADTAPDKLVKLSIWRDGKEQEVELKVAALNPNRPAPPPPEPEKPKPPPSVDALGLKLAKLTPELRKQFSLPETAKGVVITEVPQNSPGAAQGLRPGDLVVAVGHEPVGSLEEVQQKVAAAKKIGHKNVLVRVEREGNTRFIALPFEAG